MRIRTLGLALCLALTPPATALADSTIQPPPPGQPQIFAQQEPKPGFGAIEVDVDCEIPAQPGDQTCSTKLQLLANGTVVDERVVTVPLDGNDVVYDVDVSAIRDKALGTKKARITSILKAFSADGSVFLNQEKRTDSAFAGWNRRAFGQCGWKRVIKASGQVTAQPGNFPPLTLKGMVPAYFPFETGDQPVTVGWNGLTYTVAPHTLARFDCIYFSTSAGPIAVPAPLLSSGEIEAVGRPHRQIASAIVTPEATFRSLTRERVKFRVKRDAKTRISEMNADTGRTLQATHISGLSANFPCKPGHSIKVGRKGPIG